MKNLISKKYCCNGQAVQYRILKHIVVAEMKSAGWFRIFGRGIKWKYEKLGLLFSERIGKRKHIKIGRWVFGYLPLTKHK